MQMRGLFVLLILSFSFQCVLSDVDADSKLEDANDVVNASEFNSSRSTEVSFANMIDQALEKEFNETDDKSDVLVCTLGQLATVICRRFIYYDLVGLLLLEGDKGLAPRCEAVLETVARVKPKKNETKEEKSFQLHDVFHLENDNGAEDTPTLIDRKDNVFIMSNRKSKFPVLQLDLRLISDLVVVIVSATCGGIAFACAGQPVFTGYLLAGSIIGPGGFNFVSEMVQVETVAQFGVIFLLFALGLEFSTAKLRIVRAVAVLGGLLQIFLFMCLSGITASVLKFLMERNSVNTLYGQVTIGTLILQDCTVGLLFALLPILGGTSGALKGMFSMAKLFAVLVTFLTILSVLCRTCVPWFLRLMIGLSSQTNELYQLASVAFCLLVAWVCLLFISLNRKCRVLNFLTSYYLLEMAYLWIKWTIASQCSDKLGLSLELGSFAAGVMISTTDLAQHTLEQVCHLVHVISILFSSSLSLLSLSTRKVEPIRNFFAALFLASIGMLIHVHFLWNHIDILVAAVILVIVIKTIVVAAVVKGFGYTNKVAILVGMSLAQIGEFAFVLLSRASNLHLIEVTTPLLFKLIPAVVHLGVLLRWFSPEIPNEIGPKGDILRADSSKRISVLIQGSRDS
ncbi:hypothetical protein RND71_038288 [Anisodus tanguticus]|uniref:Cation/H+ exchanger transmembrane domain-containing protein n=1 Tax=Anisodus tanguticus TaxID=243964 RepID=A0AAE1UTD3_9SOLA|nr:hypothetical protein RND71_038288 [Anisodus tanguticus]